MIWAWLLLQQVWTEKKWSLLSMRCFPEYKRWVPWRWGPHWAGRPLHGLPAPKRCPDHSCTAREGAGHCSLLDSQPTPQREGDDRLLDREDLSRGLRAKEAEGDVFGHGLHNTAVNKFFSSLDYHLSSCHLFIVTLPLGSCETFGKALNLLSSLFPKKGLEVA